jgi:hypothetical protein
MSGTSAHKPNLDSKVPTLSSINFAYYDIFQKPNLKIKMHSNFKTITITYIFLEATTATTFPHNNPTSLNTLSAVASFMTPMIPTR